MRGKWDEYVKTVKKLEKMNDYIKVRLLMTKGCIEYYFLLHFEKTAPIIQIPADKEKIEELLRKKYVYMYQKGDKEAISKIAGNYEQAINNGKWSLKQIQNEVGGLADTIERNRNLFMTDRTFSNAYEGIENLKCLLDKKRSGY